MNSVAGSSPQAHRSAEDQSLLWRSIRRGVLVEPHETHALGFSALYFFLILFSYYLLRPVRDAMGIRGDIENLPWLWTGTSLAMLAAVPLFAVMASRLPRRRFIPLVYRLFALSLVVFYGLFMLVPEELRTIIGYGLFIWLSVFNLFIVSVFWGFMADKYTTEQGKRLFGTIAVGGTLGATCGAAVPALLVGAIGPFNLLLISALTLELAVQCVRRLLRIFGLRPLKDRPTIAFNQSSAVLASTPEPGRGILTGITRIAVSPYLLHLVAYMLLFTITSTYLYLEQGRLVKAQFADDVARTSFFAWMDLLVNALALVTQLFLTGRILTRLGVAVGLMLVPALAVIGFAGLAASTMQAATAGAISVLFVFQVGRRAMHYAIDRPAREVLYTVLGAEEKYKSKSFIDTFVYRGGDLIGAWSPALLAQLGVALSVAAILLAALWMITGARLGWMQTRLALAKAGQANQLPGPMAIDPVGAPSGAQ